MFQIETALINWLKEKTGLPAYGVVPESRPDEFLLVERVGGAAKLGLDMPSVAIQCWAQTTLKAAQLAEIVKGYIIRDLAHEVLEISWAEVNSLYNYPDPESGQATYQIYVNLWCRP